MIVNVAIVIPYRRLSDGVLYFFQIRESKEGSDIFEFPGGKLEPGEELIECAIREIQEETGVQLTSTMLEHFSTISIPLNTKTISMGIYLTDALSLFPESGYIKLGNLSKLEDQLSTLPANYKIIRDVQNYIMSQKQYAI